MYTKVVEAVHIARKDMNTTVHQSFYASFIPSNPNTPLLLAVSSPPLTPPTGPSSTAGSRQPMPSRASFSSSPSSFPILSLNLVILRSELSHELTSKSTNLALSFTRSPPPVNKKEKLWFCRSITQVTTRCLDETDGIKSVCIVYYRGESKDSGEEVRGVGVMSDRGKA